MASSVVVVGAGGFGREVAELIRDLSRSGAGLEFAGFLSDDEATWGTVVNDAPVLGGLSWLESHPDAQVALGVGSPATKCRIVSRLRWLDLRFPVLVHPTVIRSPYVDLGPGTIVTAGNILTANIVLGAYAMLNLACTVGHDTVLGDYVSVSPRVAVSGNVSIKAGCDVGTGSALIQGVTVGEWSIIGAGAVVAGNLPPNCTAVGVPAKAIKQRPAGWHNSTTT